MKDKINEDLFSCKIELKTKTKVVAVNIKGLNKDGNLDFELPSEENVENAEPIIPILLNVFNNILPCIMIGLIELDNTVFDNDNNGKGA